MLGRCEQDALRRHVEAAGIRHLPMARPHPDPEDLDCTLATLDSLADGVGGRAWLALDGYRFDPGYQQAIRSAGYQLVVIDDMAHWPQYHATVLVNQTVQASRFVYRWDSDTVPLLGPQYVLVQAGALAWKGWSREIPPRARKVLVTLGGFQSAVSESVMSALRAVAARGLVEAVYVAGLPVAGTAVPDAPGVRVLPYADDMPALMAWADVAVTGGGISSLEAAFMGLPNLVVELTDNQRGNAEGLHEAGAALNLGDGARLQAGRVVGALERLMESQEQRVRMREAGRRLIDGDGARRILDVLKHQPRPDPVHS